MHISHPTTDCGRNFEHDVHLYEVRGGKKVCDGRFREVKTRD